MSFEISRLARIATEKANLEPNMVLKIEGISTVFGAVITQKKAQFGEDGITFGQLGLVFGGLIAIGDQSPYLSFDGTTTKIQQQLEPDKGSITSVSSLEVSLIDFNDEISNLITPGEVVTDVLGRRCRLYLGFKGIPFDEYITIHRGIVSQIVSDPGRVQLTIAHPDQKKRQELFIPSETKLNGAINNTQTTITVDSTANFLTPPADTSLKTYIRIDDEIIRYTSYNATQFLGCTRAQLGTLSPAAGHDDNAAVTSFYVLEGQALPMALKLMLSGWNGPFTTGVEIESFNQVDVVTNIPNSIFFPNIDVFDEYGIVAGDFVSTSGSAFGANNVSEETITDIVQTDFGSYIVVGGVSFVTEAPTSATASFRSQYDTLGVGLQMYPDEVDVPQHEFLHETFLSTAQYRFYFREDSINGKDFLEQEIYKPIACYALPRQAKASANYTIGPVPRTKIPVIDKNNVVNASKIRLKRSTNRNFANTIIFKFDEYELEKGKLLGGNLTVSNTSKTQIPVGTKAMKIESLGMRTDLQAQSIATQAANRFLLRYKFGAELLERVEVKFGDAWYLEPGDIVRFDGDDLHISDIKNEGKREFKSRLMEIQNKTIDIKTGSCEFSLVDTAFTPDTRYGLVSPASLIQAGISQTQFVIQSSFSSKYGADEYRKWEDYIGAAILIHNTNYSTVSAVALITNITGNTITVDTALGFTPSAGMTMELAHYDFQPLEVTLSYAFMREAGPFGDGTATYKIL